MAAKRLYKHVHRDDKDNVSQSDEAGIPLINTTVRFCDGILANNCYAASLAAQIISRRGKYEKDNGLSF